MAAMSPESLDFIMHHVVLPPKLPQEAEDLQISRAAERDLIGLLSTQLKTYRVEEYRHSSSIHAVWASVEEMLDRCKLLASTHALCADLLVRAFPSMETFGETCDMVL